MTNLFNHYHGVAFSEMLNAKTLTQSSSTTVKNGGEAVLHLSHHYLLWQFEE